jgi:hypothetical protein
MRKEYRSEILQCRSVSSMEERKKVPNGKSPSYDIATDEHPYIGLKPASILTFQ